MGLNFIYYIFSIIHILIYTLGFYGLITFYSDSFRFLVIPWLFMPTCKQAHVFKLNNDPKTRPHF